MKFGVHGRELGHWQADLRSQTPYTQHIGLPAVCLTYWLLADMISLLEQESRDAITAPHTITPAWHSGLTDGRVGEGLVSMATESGSCRYRLLQPPAPQRRLVICLHLSWTGEEVVILHRDV